VGYVDDLLDDFFHENEEEDFDREIQRPSSGAP
jgi:hypothetical protein